MYSYMTADIAKENYDVTTFLNRLAQQGWKFESIYNNTIFIFSRKVVGT